MPSPPLLRALAQSDESFARFAAEINAARIGLLVCDEGHRLKNAKGTKTMQMLNACPARRRVILTGTPVQNELQEVRKRQGAAVWILIAIHLQSLPPASRRTCAVLCARQFCE